MTRMDQEPERGDEPIDPPTIEEQRAEAWEYWHQRARRFETALYEISTHWANQYDHPRKENEMYRGSYGIGVTDGHRACKAIADAALACRE